MAGIPFTKMEGIGNDYVYIDLFKHKVENAPALAVKMSDRHFGVGSDGLILIAPSGKADARMIMYNSDGSESEMCGNGLRCVAKYVYDHGIARKEKMSIETGRGVLTLELKIKNGKADAIRVNMGKPILKPLEIPAKLEGERVVNKTLKVLDKEFALTCVSMGNPHCVVYVDDVEGFDIRKYGPAFEHHEIFPRRTNTEFVQVLGKTEVRQRTWERGAGETWACGTGAGAVCVAGVLTGRTERKILIHLLGGDLDLEWREADDCVYKTGPAVEVFSGVWPL